jgi:hypothetical protein
MGFAARGGAGGTMRFLEDTDEGFRFAASFARFFGASFLGFGFTRSFRAALA